MQLKIGASAEIDVTVNADGDILVQIIDKEALSDQGAHVAIHPQALTQAISKLAGGNATLSGLLSYVVPVLIGLLPKA